MLRSQVGRHDDDRVAKVHRAALAVSQAAVIQHLQQYIEYIRVRFFDLVQQNNAIGLASHGLGKIAALRSEEHTSELQSLMRISYAVFCLKKKKKHTANNEKMSHQLKHVYRHTNEYTENYTAHDI